MNENGEILFHEYFKQWMEMYKAGAVRDVTFSKYKQSYKWLVKIAPDVRVCDLNRLTYQKIINDYGKEHERQTVMDFHHQIKGSIMDAIDDGMIGRDPTRKVVIKGRKPRTKKMKYLGSRELEALIATLELGNEPDWNWLILLTAKTGMRFSEVLGLTVEDFDFAKQEISINKTLDYKKTMEFTLTKNRSSVRIIKMDWKLFVQMQELLKDIPKDRRVFLFDGKKIYNSTVNDFLARKCKECKVPPIGIHALRHTHASILLYEGVSIASVAKRLGHASMSTTQKTYLHIITELENKDNNKVMSAMCGF